MSEDKNEMVDRLILVARAVFEAGRTAGVDFNNEFWRLLVLSQIEAMRDPTVVMLAAARVDSAEDTWRAMISAILGKAG